MALRILFRPTGLVLSSAIGNIGIETDAESMDVVLKDSDGHILLQERYFSFNGMLMLYQNFRSNDITKQAVLDSIAAYSNSFVNKDASLFEDMEFKFLCMIKEEGDSVNVMLRGEASSEIESNAEGAKYIISDIRCLAVGYVSKEAASALSSGYKYSVTGTVEQVIIDDVDFKAEAITTPSDLFFGAFAIKDMKITKIEE